ncbi:hypothetical protein AB0M87_18285 [Streptomyces sp. NPDC051320]|uniref:hypothetical protein n=1 Tax=Streptomyces sp. NPDC051320 TaxID=3154644 RepID=UPI0034269C7E
MSALLEPPTFPREFWKHFVEDLAPAMDQLSKSGNLTEIGLIVEVDDSSVPHVAQLLDEVDRWFRWGQAVGALRHKYSPDNPPPAHTYPVSPKEFTFEIARVENGSLRAFLKATGGTLTGMALVLEVFHGVTGQSPLEFFSEDHANSSVRVPGPSEKVVEQERGLFGVREGGGGVHIASAHLTFKLDDGATFSCPFKVASRVVDNDGMFVSDISATCTQFQEADDRPS